NREEEQGNREEEQGNREEEQGNREEEQGNREEEQGNREEEQEELNILDNNLINLLEIKQRLNEANDARYTLLKHNPELENFTKE
ncbi:hypothetical protein J5751_00165, partial [bacterium]|nr:hypothetical protein [bacterium]